MSKPKIFIVGPKGSGKTEFGRMVSAAIRRRIGSVVMGECGQVLVDLMAREYALLPWPQCVDVDAWKAFIVARKEEYRAAMRERGDQMTQGNPSYLINACDGADVVVGVRRQREAESLYEFRSALHEQAADANHHWIYVTRPGAAPGNDSFDDEFFKRFCSHVVANNGPVEQLGDVAEVVADLVAPRAKVN